MANHLLFGKSSPSPEFESWGPSPELDRYSHISYHLLIEWQSSRSTTTKIEINDALFYDAF